MLIKSLLQILEEKKGEYFTDYDGKSGSWCVNEDVERLEEKVQPLPDHILSGSLEEIMAELEKRLAAARRAMGLANKLKDEEEWKKHMSAIRGNMNTIQAAIRHVSKQLDPSNIASARMTQFQKKNKSPRKSAARDMLGLGEAVIESGDWVKTKKDRGTISGVVARVDGDTAYVRTHNTNKVVPVKVAHLTKSMNESAEKPESRI